MRRIPRLFAASTSVFGVLSAEKFRRQQNKVIFAKSVWKISEFSLNSTICGVTTFPYASWGDFVTYTDDDGNANGHVWLHALTKNYLEIAMSNLFRQGLGLDHVCFANDSDWAHKGFFMRYQEMELTSDFYDGLSCPRRSNADVASENLTISSALTQVGTTSILMEQTLIVGDENVGRSKHQICCIDRRTRGLSKLPESFTSHTDISPLTTEPKPRFPLNFIDSNCDYIGVCNKEVFMTDTDENKHLNEGGYLRFIMDAFYKVQSTDSKALRIRSMQALYKKEILRGDICQIHMFYNKVDNFYCASFITNETEAFQMRFDFH